MDSGEGAVKKNGGVLCLSLANKTGISDTKYASQRMPFLRACDFPLSPTGSDIRDGRTGVKKRTYVKSECCVRAGFARSKPSG